MSYMKYNLQKKNYEVHFRTLRHSLINCTRRGVLWYDIKLSL